MKNKLTIEEEASMIQYLNHGTQPTSELADLVRSWDSIPHDALDPDHPQYLRRVLLLGSYLNWSHKRTWAWDGMQKLLGELQRRKEPVPEILQMWAYAVALGQLPRPGSGRGRKREWDRDIRIFLVLQKLQGLGYSWEEAINQIADWMFLTFDAVKVAERKFERDWPVPIELKKQLRNSLLTTGESE